jgi:hypothetical protein
MKSNSSLPSPKEAKFIFIAITSELPHSHIADYQRINNIQQI